MSKLRSLDEQASRTAEGYIGFMQVAQGMRALGARLDNEADDVAPWSCVVMHKIEHIQLSFKLMLDKTRS